MNRDQKAAFVEDVTQRLGESDAVFAVDYRGITVSQTAELRGKLREADASFQVVKNTLTRIAVDRAGNDDLKAFLEGPTAFTYVKGDVAAAAKAIADFTKEYELLSYKGGIMEGQVVTSDQFDVLTKLPSRQVLYGQLVGMIASPLSGLARALNGLIGGLAIQLGKIAEQGLVTGSAPAATEVEDAPTQDAQVAGTDPVTEDAPSKDEAPVVEADSEGEPPAESESGEQSTADEPSPDDGPAVDAEIEAPAEEPKAESDEPTVTGDDA